VQVAAERAASLQQFCILPYGEAAAPAGEGDGEACCAPEVYAGGGVCRAACNIISPSHVNAQFDGFQ